MGNTRKLGFPEPLYQLSPTPYFQHFVSFEDYFIRGYRGVTPFDPVLWQAEAASHAEAVGQKELSQATDQHCIMF